MRFSRGTGRDVTTIREIVMLMEAKYGHANRVWVTDLPRDRVPREIWWAIQDSNL
jgi:hypothetical protein